ncbi:MAG: hypothetical protein RLZZ628_553 [Bacteroidota bacterium]|jgi:hypothetical protein
MNHFVIHLKRAGHDLPLRFFDISFSVLCIFVLQNLSQIDFLRHVSKNKHKQFRSRHTKQKIDLQINRKRLLYPPILQEQYS